MSTDQPVDEGPGLDRTITLTDAVVAIAMTLLILPLVDVVTDLDVADLPALWSENSQLLLSFVISFLVIHAFWTAHGSLYRRLIAADRTSPPWLGTLNMFWLLAIAFLPFPTALVGREATRTSTPIYLGAMLVLSVLTLAMTVVVQRHLGRPLGLAWLTSAVLALCLVASLFNAQLGLYLLLLLILTGRVEGRSDAMRRARADA